MTIAVRIATRVGAAIRRCWNRLVRAVSHVHRWGCEQMRSMNRVADRVEAWESLILTAVALAVRDPRLASAIREVVALVLALVRRGATHAPPPLSLPSP